MNDAVTICIVTHSRPDLLGQLLDALPCATNGCEAIRTIVVENGGCHESQQIAASAPDKLHLEYLWCKSPLKCTALNMAIERIERGLVVFIDDDALPCEGWLAAYCRSYQEHGAKYYYGGPTIARYDVPPPEWLKKFLPPSAVAFSADNVSESNCSRLSFIGFNWAADVASLRTCGGFSEEFGPGTDLGRGDEAFMQFQLQEAGLASCYLNQALVSHYVPACRCSPEWAMRRAYRGGICRGIMHEHYHRTRRLPVGRLRGLLRMLRKKTSREDLFRLCRLHPAGRYWMRYCVALGNGFWKGLKRGARDKPLMKERWSEMGLGFIPELNPLPCEQA